jgi:ABC-type transport system involved in Fe-S cluster assembly fused permease/ATPase subunit
VALVSQNVHLFNDTVANNIAYARTEEYSREQIEEAARMAYAMDFINKMDNGLDTLSVRTAYCSPAVSVSVLLSRVRCCVTARF